MLELGDQEKEFHRFIGKNLDPLKINYVYTFGALSSFIALEAEKKFPIGSVETYMDKMELAKALNSMIKKNDVILLKASRGNTNRFNYYDINEWSTIPAVSRYRQSRSVNGQISLKGKIKISLYA